MRGESLSRSESKVAGLSRRTLLIGAGSALITPPAALAASPAYLSGKGKFRSISLRNNRTSETLNTVYWVEGEYIPEALEAVNYIMRDWREEQIRSIDIKTVDIVAATHNLLDCSEAFEIVSGYRSPATNAMLRSRSRGVARNSYHVRGMAVDLSLKTRSVSQVAGAALSLTAGGVGKYRRSNFTHVDSGPVRDWGR